MKELKHVISKHSGCPVSRRRRIPARVPAQVRALRYALAETDFVIRRGVINRSLTLVPYGRIQYVDIKQGPVLRFMGIATIKLSTASAHTDATLSGVPVADAVGLRDVLAERGSAELMGL